MDCQKIDFAKTNRFSSFFLDYINKKDKLADFYDLYPDIENFQDQINKKRNFPHRDVLVKVLQEQYRDLDIDPKVSGNIDALKSEKTFTVVTGHQLNIFSGPLYFIYKIITVINACKELKKAYPQYNFVPVYWMATEDHDFEEINHFRLGGQKYTWQTDQKGAVGRFNPTSIKELVKEIKGIPEFFKEAYSKTKLTDAVRYYVNYLFQKEGLVVVDADHKSFKQLFKEVIKDDITKNSAKKLTSAQLEKLLERGYATDIFPREINFFYLEDQLRERIEKSGDEYKVLNSKFSFSKEQLLKQVEGNPERFSPNVILRPLYQETILPNLAYVGGPAEVVYWLPLKPVFEHYGVPFPIVMPRNFAMVIPQYIQNKLDKTGLSNEEFFYNNDTVIKNALKRFTSKDIQLNGQIDQLEEMFTAIKEQAEKIDPTLVPHVDAQKAKTKKRLAIIEKKFIRAEKRNQTDKLRQVESVLEFLFPNGGLQERTDNFLNFYMGNPDFIEDLKESFDPFDFRFHILNYGE